MRDFLGNMSSWKAALALPLMAVAVLCSLIASEAFSYGAKIGLLLVRLAARLLSAESRDRYREEWSSDVLRLGEGGHQLTALLWGAGSVVAAVRKASIRELAHETWEWLSPVRTTITVVWTILCFPMLPPLIFLTGVTMMVAPDLSALVGKLNFVDEDLQSYATVAVAAALYFAALVAIPKRVARPVDSAVMSTMAGLPICFGLGLALDYPGLGTWSGLLVIYLGGLLAFPLLTYLGCSLNRMLKKPASDGG